MAGSKNLTPPTLDLTVDRYAAWTAWKERWNDYIVCAKLTDETNKYQCSMLRYTFTEDTRKIYNALKLTNEQSENPKDIIEALEKFARGIINETMERHTFNTRRQESGKKFDDFLTDIKNLSKNCNFCATCYEGLIRDRIVGGINDSRVRRKLLS